jgi:O-6-methylguanine DNA methyltransferase
MPNFTKQVKEVVRKIPKGEIMTYGEAAQAAGKPKAARAVANIMAKNYDPLVPCHRVVRVDGSPGGYNRGGESVKQELLCAEGVVLLSDGRLRDRPHKRPDRKTRA